MLFKPTFDVPQDDVKAKKAELFKRNHFVTLFICMILGRYVESILGTHSLMGVVAYFVTVLLFMAYVQLKNPYILAIAVGLYVYTNGQNWVVAENRNDISIVSIVLVCVITVILILAMTIPIFSKKE